MTYPERLRVVFDTNTVISALAFTTGRLAWLRGHWRERQSVSLVSQATATEFKWVLRTLGRLLAILRSHCNHRTLPGPMPRPQGSAIPRSGREWAGRCAGHRRQGSTGAGWADKICNRSPRSPSKQGFWRFLTREFRCIYHNVYTERCFALAMGR